MKEAFMCWQKLVGVMPRNPLQQSQLCRQRPHLTSDERPERLNQPSTGCCQTSEQKARAQPNRQLFKRSTYAGVTDTGPVPGETFEQKVARLKAVSVAAKQRAEEGGATTPAPPAPHPSLQNRARIIARTKSLRRRSHKRIQRVRARQQLQPAAHKTTGNATVH